MINYSNFLKKLIILVNQINNLTKDIGVIFFIKVNDKFWDKKDGPIFLYICGEAECAPRSIEGSDFDFGSKLKARLITLEHR